VVFKLRGERSASSAIIALISLVPLLTVFLGHGSIFQLVVHRSQLLTKIPLCLTFCALRPVAA
jgi:hypothetical protein